LNHLQAGDQLKVTDIGRSHTVFEVEGGRPDQQIRQRNADAPRLALAVHLSGAKSDWNRDRLYGDTHQQFIKETLPLLAALWCVGAGDAVSKFKYRYDRNGDSVITSFQGHVA